MPGNSFGKLFKITNWGESHGKAIGVVVDGCPPMLGLNEDYIQKSLNRRAPGQSEVTTQRQEPDKVEILSGVFNGKTTGTPISMIIFNKDFRKEDYKDIAAAFRPSHSDFTMQKKFGIRDPLGGGRSSARLTAGNVAAGAIAYKILNERFGIEIIAYVVQIKDIRAEIDSEKVSKKDVDSNIVRCPDKNAAKQMINLVEDAKNSGDSVGGIIECIVRNVPIGLGEPIFDKLEADLAKAMLCINATKGFEIGSGFEGIKMFGSQHNDAFVMKNGKVATKTNNSGGVQGGISNGMPIIFRVAFKPTSTIQKEQDTVDIKGKSVKLAAKGRHDPCVLPRAVPIVEAMAALVLCDHYLGQRAQNGDKFD
ncbi:MAG TPA: chorismate synthase [Candidatus Nanoarchaeia archaeon]|nr:chorismate synthase [Candidatus Nanoarchaeia archaeon]